MIRRNSMCSKPFSPIIQQSCYRLNKLEFNLLFLCSHWPPPWCMSGTACWIGGVRSQKTKGTNSIFLLLSFLPRWKGVLYCSHITSTRLVTNIYHPIPLFCMWPFVTFVATSFGCPIFLLNLYVLGGMNDRRKRERSYILWLGSYILNYTTKFSRSDVFRWRLGVLKKRTMKSTVYVFQLWKEYSLN
jgi:hypothetical protein